MTSGIDPKPTGDGTGPEEKQSHARTSRTIRFSDPEWERVEIAARRSGATAAEFIRNAALALAGEETGVDPGPIPSGTSAMIERIYRGVYLLSTLKRDELVLEGRKNELDRVMKDARESQAAFLDDTSK